MLSIGKLGQDEGKHTGPPAGDGADVAHTPDTDGTPGDELPDIRLRFASEDKFAPHAAHGPSRQTKPGAGSGWRVP